MQLRDDACSCQSRGRSLREVGGRTFQWRQVAIYRVEGGRISEIRAYEEPERASDSWA